MKKNKILIIGSTGILGKKLLSFCYKKNITIDGIVCKSNFNLLNLQSKKYKIKNTFCIQHLNDETLFHKYLNKNKFKIIYFLDHGSNSIIILSNILKNQKNCFICIANKEMIIAGGRILIDLINKTNNYLIPLDSEHFSLLNSNFNNENIKEILITASGGPFYFKKKINLNNVSKKRVLSHPKWEMGFNNLIDSSNFINKILEIFELSSIFKIDINKINFIISPSAFVHSLVIYKDNTISLNCFNNDMLITLTKPLSYIYEFNINQKNNLLFNTNSFYFEKPNDKRFKLLNILNKLKKLSHAQQIQFMLFNNLAQKLYLSNKLKYNEILDFILKKISCNDVNLKLNSFNNITKLIYSIKTKYNI